MSTELHPLHTEESLRRELLAASHALHQRGWVSNHDGNVSARLGGGRFLCTPTAVSKGDVEPEWMLVVDEAGAVVQGDRRSFSEWQLHQAAYAARPDITVVLHAHPPHATAFAVSGKPLGHPFMVEPVVSLGPVIPVVPHHLPKTPALGAAVQRALAQADVALLDRHGVIVVGGCVEQALLRLELLEHLATIAHRAQGLGGTRPLDPEEVAGLAKKGRPASWPERSPEPTAATDAGLSIDRAGSHPGLPLATGPRPDVSALVQDALSRLR